MKKAWKIQLVVVAFFTVFTQKVNAQWVRTGGPCGGNIHAFAVSGNNIFAGTEQGGIFLTSNDGTTWTAVDSGFPEGESVYSLAVSGSRILAGTYAGVFLTTDSGASWTNINTRLTDYQI